MRRVFALLAALALLIGPMNVAAAQALCAGPEAMASTNAPAVKAEPSAQTHHECCDESGRSAHDGKGCAQVCAAMCATIAPLPTSEIWLPTVKPMRLTAALAHPLRAHAPPRDERPPKLIA